MKTEVKTALICFFDIENSSNYGQVYSIEEYANKVIDFEHDFNKLYNLYFSDLDKSNYTIKKEIKGDEGLIIILFNSEESLSNPQLRSILSFSYILKHIVSKYFEIGVGIHIGDIAVVQDGDEYKYIGQNINFAKRVETASREGKFSKIFFSKEAHNLMHMIPASYDKTYNELKGIGKQIQLYEVKSCLFAFPESKFKEIESLLSIDSADFYVRLSYYFHCQNDPSLTSISRGVLFETIEKLIYKINIENDPIFFLFKGLIEEGKKKHFINAYVNYKKAHELSPSLIILKYHLVNICTQLTNDKLPLNELIDLKCYANELIERHQDFLGKNCIEIENALTTINDKIDSYS